MKWNYVILFKFAFILWVLYIDIMNSSFSSLSCRLWFLPLPSESLFPMSVYVCVCSRARAHRVYLGGLYEHGWEAIYWSVGNFNHRKNGTLVPQHLLTASSPSGVVGPCWNSSCEGNHYWSELRVQWFCHVLKTSLAAYLPTLALTFFLSLL